jgi:hypothetical protein
MSASPDDDVVEVVKWYTNARKFPQLIGKTPDGARIWGGPYTFTQVGVGVGVVVVATQTSWLWGHFGLVGNIAIVGAVLVVAVWAAGQLPIGSRNPLSIGAGVLRAVSAPNQGHLAGAGFRLRRPRRIRSHTVITATADIPSPPPTPVRAIGVTAIAHDVLAGLPDAHRLTHAPRSLRPTPGTVRAAEAPALTGIQKLLATTKED